MSNVSTGWCSCFGIGKERYICTSIRVTRISIRCAYHGGSIRRVPHWEMDTPRVHDAIIIQIWLIGNGECLTLSLFSLSQNSLKKCLVLSNVQTLAGKDEKDSLA